MLLYHPMLDPYHCSLRALSLLSDSRIQKIEWDRFRLLDFLIVFPHTLKKMRVPTEYRSRRRFLGAIPEPYELLPNMTRIFYQVLEIQTAAMRLLAAAELIQQDALEHQQIQVTIRPDAWSIPLVTATQQLQYRSENWYAFITECLVSYPMNGSGGLKERTGLMEHRHDAA